MPIRALEVDTRGSLLWWHVPRPAAFVGDQREAVCIGDGGDKSRILRDRAQPVRNRKSLTLECRERLWDSQETVWEYDVCQTMTGHCWFDVLQSSASVGCRLCGWLMGEEISKLHTT